MKRLSLLLCALAGLGLSACNDQTTPPPAPAVAPAPAPRPAPVPPPAPAPVAAPVVAAPSGPAPVVLIKTSMGDIKVQLDAEKAPATVANFLSYVDKSFYDGTIFHRVIPGFMIEGGGLTKDLTEKPTGAPVQNESNNGLHNTKGTIAMARRPDPNSATAQFFINTVDNPFLDNPPGRAYTVFGKVISGQDVVDKIRVVPTGQAPNGMGDVPKEPVTIESVRRVKE